MNRSESGALVDEVFAAYNRVPDKANYDAWHNSALGRVDHDHAASVLRKLIAEEEYLPTPARFNALARSGSKPVPLGCNVCDDGFVVVVDDRNSPTSPTKTVRPCERCAPRLHRSWVSGAFNSTLRREGRPLALPRGDF